MPRPHEAAAIEACLEWLCEVDRRLARFGEACEPCHSDWYGRAAVRHLAEDEPLLAALGASGVGSFGAEEHTSHNDYAWRDD